MIKAGSIETSNSYIIVTESQINDASLFYANRNPEEPPLTEAEIAVAATAMHTSPIDNELWEAVDKWVEQLTWIAMRLRDKANNNLED